MKIDNDSFLPLHDAGSLSDEEFLLLYDMSKSNLTLPYWNYPKFDLDSIENDECVSEFQFEKKDVYILGGTLEIPESIIFYNGSKVYGIESLCIFLKRLPIHAGIRTWSVDSKDPCQNFFLSVIMSWTLCMTDGDICTRHWISSVLCMLIFNFSLIQFMQVYHR